MIHNMPIFIKSGYWVTTNHLENGMSAIGRALR